MKGVMLLIYLCALVKFKCSFCLKEMKNETFTVVVFASDDFKHFNKQSH